VTFRTPKLAIDDFRDRMAEVLACISTMPLIAHPDGQDQSSLYFPGRDRFVPLYGGVEPLKLSVLHNVRHIQDDDDQWRVSTIHYAYDIQRERVDVSVPKVVAEFHFHPEPPPTATDEEIANWVRYSHLHVETKLDVVARKHHIPSGRVSLESVIRFLITQFEVTALRDDWEPTLVSMEESFVSSWQY